MQRERGRVIKVLDFESVGPGLESHSEHFMDLFHGSPELSNSSAALVNSQLVYLPPVLILNHVMSHLQHLFQLFERHARKLAGLSQGSTGECLRNYLNNTNNVQCERRM